MKANKKALLVLVGVLMATPGIGKSPLQKALEPIAKQYKMILLYPPRTSVSPGDSYRKSDTQVKMRGCFEGTPTAGPMVGVTERTAEYTQKAGLEADWLGALGLTVDYNKTSKVVLKLGAFNEQGLINIRPSYNPECLKEGYVSKDPIFASVVEIGSIEADVFDKNGVKLGLDASKEAFKQVSEVTGKIGFEHAGSSSTKLVGAKVFTFARSFQPKVDERQFRLTCSLNAVCKPVREGYMLTLKGVESDSAQFAVTNPNLVPTLNGEPVSLALGNVAFLWQKYSRRDFIVIDSIDKEKGTLKITLNTSVANVEAGPLGQKVASK